MCVLPFLLCFRISYYAYWSTHHWRDIKGQCQFYWMQTKQQTNWSVYELLRHFICSQSHLTNVHGVLRWTGGPSRVYFILAPSIPRWGSRTMATLTMMKHLLKSECGSWQQQSATQQWIFFEIFVISDNAFKAVYIFLGWSLLVFNLFCYWATTWKNKINPEQNIIDVFQVTASFLSYVQISPVLLPPAEPELQYNVIHSKMH